MVSSIWRSAATSACSLHGSPSIHFLPGARFLLTPMLRMFPPLKHAAACFDLHPLWTALEASRRSRTCSVRDTAGRPFKSDGHDYLVLLFLYGNDQDSRSDRLLSRKKKTPVSTGVLVVPLVGLEPTRSHDHRILSPARLPIPPQGVSISGGNRTHTPSRILEPKSSASA